MAFQPFTPLPAQSQGNQGFQPFTPLPPSPSNEGNGNFKPLTTGIQYNQPASTPTPTQTPPPKQQPNNTNILQTVEKGVGNAFSNIGSGINTTEQIVNKGLQMFNNLPGVVQARAGVKAAFNKFINITPGVSGQTIGDTVIEGLKNFNPIGATQYAPAKNTQAGNITELKGIQNQIENGLGWYSDLYKSSINAAQQIVTMPLQIGQKLAYTAGADVSKPLPQSMPPTTLPQKIASGVTQAITNIYMIQYASNVFAKLAYGNATVQSVLADYPKLKFLPGFLSSVLGFEVNSQLDPQTKDHFRQFLVDTASAGFMQGTGAIPSIQAGSVKIPAFILSSPLNFTFGFGLAKMYHASNQDALIAGGILAGLDISNRMGEALFASRMKNGTLHMTPEEAMDNIPGGQLENTPIGKDLLKAALEAKANGQEIDLVLNTSKESAASEFLGKEYRGVGYTIRLTDVVSGETGNVNDIKNLPFDEKGAVNIGMINGDKPLLQLEQEAAKEAYMHGNKEAVNSIQSAGEHMTGGIEAVHANYEDAVNAGDYDLARELARQSGDETLLKLAGNLSPEAYKEPANTGNTSEAGGIDFFAKVQMPAITKEIQGFTSQIPDEEINKDEGGLIEKPQIIAGTLDDAVTQQQVEEALKGVPPIAVELGKTFTVETPTNEQLRVNVVSPQLQSIQSQLNIPSTPENQPSIPVANLLPGTGQQYAQSNALAGLPVTLPQLTFNTKNGQQITIPLSTATTATTAIAQPSTALTPFNGKSPTIPDKGLSPANGKQTTDQNPFVQPPTKGGNAPAFSVPLRKGGNETGIVKEAIKQGQKETAIRLYNGYRIKGRYLPAFPVIHKQALTEMKTTRQRLQGIRNFVASQIRNTPAGNQLMEAVKTLERHYKEIYSKPEGLEPSQMEYNAAHGEVTKLNLQSEEIVTQLTDAQSFADFTHQTAMLAKEYGGAFTNLYDKIESGIITKDEYNKFKTYYQSLQTEDHTGEGVSAGGQSKTSSASQTSGQPVQSAENREPVQTSANAEQQPESSARGNTPSGHDQAGENKPAANEPVKPENINTSADNRSRNGAVSTEPNKRPAGSAGGNKQLIGEKQKKGDGVGYAIYDQGKNVGHVSGFEAKNISEFSDISKELDIPVDGEYFNLQKTELNPDSRGKGLYQKAIQQVADKYKYGLVSEKFQSSIALVKSLQKISTLSETDHFYYIKPLRSIETQSEPVNRSGENEQLIPENIQKYLQDKFGKTFETATKSEVSKAIKGEEFVIPGDNPDILQKLSSPNRGYTTERSELMYGNIGKNMFTDGYILILDRTAANKLNDPIYEQSVSDYRSDLQRNQNLNYQEANIRAKQIVADIIKDAEATYPNINNVIPHEEGSKAVIQGIAKDSDLSSPYVVLSDGKTQKAVDINKFALLSKFFPRDSIYFSDSSNEYKPNPLIIFKRVDTIDALVAPIRKDSFPFKPEGGVEAKPEEETETETAQPLFENNEEQSNRSDFIDRFKATEQMKKELADNGYLLKTSPNATVTIYHGASDSRYQQIMETGRIEPDTFFSHAKNKSAFGSAGASDYGKVLSIQADPRDIHFNGGTGEIEALNGLVRGVDNIWRSPERAGENIEAAEPVVENEPTPEAHERQIKTLSPVVDKFVNEDIIPRAGGIKPWLNEVNHEVRSFMFPTTLADNKALNLIFTYKGDNDLFKFLNRAKYKSYSLMGKQANLIKYWDKFSKEEHQQFYNNFENPLEAAQPNPAWRELDKMYRTRYDAIYDKLSQYKEINKIDNYFRRMWDLSGRSEKDFNTYNAAFKKSLQGDLGWTKKRFYKFYMDAVKKGLIARETNPEIVTEIAEENAARFEHAQILWQDAKLAGKLTFVRVGKTMPPGLSKINDRIAKVYLPPEIPIKEFFDQNVWKRLNNFAESIGIEHVRKAGVRGREAGYTRRGEDKVVTKFASPSSVLAHELGHQLDFRYNLQDKFLRNHATNKELQKLADERYKGYEDMVSDNFRQYVRKGSEKMAVMLESLIHAPEIFREAAPTVYKEFTDFLSNHEELKPLLNIKPSLVLGSRKGKISAGGAVIGGDWVGEENFVRLINNHLSSDKLSNSLIGRMLQTQKALMNGMQLSMSGFHPQFLSIDSIANKLNIAERQLVKGDFKSLPKTIGSTPVGLLNYYIKGNDVIKKAFAQNPEALAALQLAARAGSHIVQPESFQATVLDNFVKNIKQGNYIGAMFRAPYAAIEGFYRPLFGELIPKAKLGVFMENYGQALIDRRNDLTSGKTDELTLARLIWRDVEDRMGELNYDNLFWNNTFKGAVQIMMRAPGWFKGTVATLGGGLKDDAEYLIDLSKYITKKGDKPIFTQRGQYLFNLLFTVMALGAAYQYLHTRKAPQSLKDYFMPHNGAKDTNGNDIRVIFASYFKDALSILNNPYLYVMNKSAPEVNLLFEELSNRDFFGNQFRDNDVPQNTKDIIQSLQFALKTGLTPFTYQQSTQETTPLSKIESLSGIMKAPARFIKSPQQTAAEAAYDKIHGLPGVKSPEQVEIDSLKTQARSEINKSGWRNSPAFHKLMDMGVLDTQQKRINFIQSAKLTSSQRLIKSLPIKTRQAVLSMPPQQ